MFDRPSESSLLREQFRDRITLTQGETKAARFRIWLAEKTGEPRFCRQHPRARLVLDNDNTGVWPAYKEPDPRPYGSYAEREVEPGAFILEAVLRCPACVVAHALCPREFHETNFETFLTSTEEQAGHLARCREFVSQVNKRRCGFALFVGGPGSGKTRLACNIIRELDSLDSLYLRFGAITSALRATYGRKDVFLHRRRATADDEDNDDPPTPLEITQDVRFLVLDEIGCNPLANDERLLLDELLKHRYEARKPTILISNLALDLLKTFLGDALSDRIAEATGNHKFVLQFTGGSYRRTVGVAYLSSIGGRPAA